MNSGNSGFGDKDKLRDALELAKSFKKGGKGSGPPPPRMSSSTFSPRAGTPSVRNRNYSGPGSFSTQAQKAVPRKIPAFDSSGKDFLLRKDVPDLKNVNGSASKPQMKDEQTFGSGHPPVQTTQEHSTQKSQIQEAAGGKQNLGSQPHQSPSTSNLARSGTGTCSKNPPTVKTENPGLASFLSFAPPGVFSTATPAASSHPTEVKKSTPNNATGTQMSAPFKTKETARPSHLEATGTTQVSLLTQKENPEAVTPGTCGPKENGQVGANGKPHQPARLVDGKPNSPSQTNKAPEAQGYKIESTPKAVLEPKEPIKGAKQPTSIAEQAPKTAPKPTQSSMGTKQPAPTVDPALKTAPEPKRPSEGESQPKLVAETVSKQDHKPVVALNSLSNGYVKEQPLADKPSETLPLRPQAEDFSPHPNIVPVPHSPPQSMAGFHSPRLLSPVHPTALSMENLQQFIPTGASTGQLVTTTQVSISGGKMTPGECRGTLYVQTPVSYQQRIPQPQGGFVPVAPASSEENRPHTQKKPTQGLASSRWNTK
ncbi:unnamed protein product [Clonostachys rosea]|uniref:Uncharacterized protein n=1 Tax=Bionectria ochroleuca TaxID=29856 RepID=A0ABY6TTT9_BIOOC|nr:unnamed protein product [Clonostachys rosea]